MSDPLAPQDHAATEFSPEEREGLIPSYITKRAELNEAEQGNILETREWALGKKRDVLKEAFVNTPPAKSRWLRVTARSRIDRPSGR